jgi:hypothetical protein
MTQLTKPAAAPPSVRSPLLETDPAPRGIHTTITIR